jgi:hypothetical protein
LGGRRELCGEEQRDQGAAATDTLILSRNDRPKSLEAAPKNSVKHVEADSPQNCCRPNENASSVKFEYGVEREEQKHYRFQKIRPRSISDKKTAHIDCFEVKFMAMRPKVFAARRTGEPIEGLGCSIPQPA